MADKKATGKASKKAKAGAKAKKASKAKASKKAAAKKAPRQKPRRKKRPEKSSETRRKKAAPKRAAANDQRPRQERRPVPQSLEQSVTLSRDRLHEVVEDAVKRGRMTRGDAEKMLSDLVNTRPQTDRLVAARAGKAGQTGAQRGRRPCRAGAQTGHPGSAPSAQETRLSLDDSQRREDGGPRPSPRRAARGRDRSLAFGGRGVARADGFVVFVAGGLPGDRVRAEITKAKKRFAEARTVELLRPGADRIADVCVHGGEPCPGAPWQGLPYERQLAHKAEQVDEALRRIGALDGFELEQIVAAGEQWRYRNKLEYSFGERGGRRADPRLPRPRALGPGRRRRRLPSRLRGRQRRPQRGARVGAAGGGAGLRPPRAPRRAAQPGRARGPAHRPDPDPPGHPEARFPAPRSTCTRSSPTSPATARGRQACCARSTCTRSCAAWSGSSRTAPSSRPTPRWPSASTRSPPSTPGSAAASASSTSSAGSARSA